MFRGSGFNGTCPHFFPSPFLSTVVEAGMLGAFDEDHLKRALNEGRVIFAQDNDFLGQNKGVLQYNNEK